MSKKKHFFHIILIFLCSCSHAHAELSLYLGGGDVGDHVSYSFFDPVPALGIHSDNYAQWNGHVLSTVMSLSNGRADSSKVPFGNIVPYQQPSGYQMSTGSTPDIGIQFEADIGYQLIQNVSANKSLPFWSINGVDIAFGLTPEISYETLIGGLGLEPGIYELELDLREYYAGDDIVTTTIQIIPEPAMLLLLSLGALILRKRRRV